MAEFQIVEIEGMRQLRIDLHEESVRVTRRSLSRMQGDLRVSAPLPGPGTLIRTAISKEAAVRPRYTGTGSVFLKPSLRGYHVFDAHDRGWVLGPGVFWAAEGEIQLGVRLERMMPSFWVGDGLINFQTVVHGDGKVAINAPGPVEEIEIGDSELVVQGRMVLGRTEGVRYRTRRVAGYIQSIIAGEPRARSYHGPGRALVCWTPYWNQYMHARFVGEDEGPNFY
jgi:uncharacterized protein (AIM24 family)